MAMAMETLMPILGSDNVDTKVARPSGKLWSPTAKAVISEALFKSRSFSVISSFTISASIAFETSSGTRDICLSSSYNDSAIMRRVDNGRDGDGDGDGDEGGAGDGNGSAVMAMLGMGMGMGAYGFIFGLLNNLPWYSICRFCKSMSMVF